MGEVRRSPPGLGIGFVLISSSGSLAEEPVCFAPGTLFFLRQDLAEPQADGVLLSVTCCNSRSTGQAPTGGCRGPRRVPALAAVSAGSRACGCLGSRHGASARAWLGSGLECGLRRRFPALQRGGCRQSRGDMGFGVELSRAEPM